MLMKRQVVQKASLPHLLDLPLFSHLHTISLFFLPKPLIKMHDDNANDDNSSFPQSCHHHRIHTRKQFEKEDDEGPWEAADQEADMTSSWSSAATGKPQLSYAERLRKAKEGTAKAETPPPPPAYTETQSTSQNGVNHHEPAQKQQKQQKESSFPTNFSPRPTPVQSPSSHDVAIKVESAGDSTAKTEETLAAGRPVINVWDARRRMLQEREKAKVEGKRVEHGLIAETPKPISSEVKLEREQGLSSARTTAKSSPNPGKGEDARGRRKKAAEAVTKVKGGSNTMPPSTADSVAWPSPNTSRVPAKTDLSKVSVDSSPAANVGSTFTSLSSSINGTSITVTSPNTSTRRLEQKRPTPLPISNQDKTETSRASDATVSSTPLRGVSPRFAQMTLSNRRSSRDHSSSPLRSPSVGNGSVRGPRFTADASSPKVAQHMLNDGVDDASTRAGASVNALQLSNGTSDGSYAPIRASASIFSPTSRSPNPQDALSMQRTQSSAPSPRGSRGRGKTSKMSDGHSVGESSGSRNDAEDRGLPSDVPVGPRRQQNGEGTPPRDGSRSGGSYRRGGLYYQPPLPYGMYGPSPPALPQGGFYYPPPGPFQLESTSSEFAPQGDAVKSEPSEALLHQIEFYFSHRNLEGDFYLRKNMDSQGFVPIQIVANFNKVKKMTDKIDVVKETLLFSKVLSVDVERDMVRKAIDWHLYILIDGERPQQNMYQQHPFHLPNRPMPPPPLPHFGQPLPPFAHTSPPFPPAHYGQPGPPFYFSSIHNHPAAPKLPSGAGQEPLHRPADSPDGHHSNGEASGDNIFGVIAAEGLAALP